MNKERAIYFAGLMEEYLDIPSCVCENIENELINGEYYKVIDYVIKRRKELENKVNYKTYREITNMYLDLQNRIEKAIEYIKYCQTSDDDIFPVIEAEKMIEILKGVE